MLNRGNMWVVISTSDKLRFFDFLSSSPIEISSLPNEALNDHNRVVKTLIENSVPLFLKKEDARKLAVRFELLGFKYLKLNPTIISTRDFHG